MTPPDTFTARLLAARAAVGSIKRDRRNPRFGSSYASLDAILHAVVPALHQHGLALTQAVTVGDHGDVVITNITDGNVSVSAATPICADRSDPQKFGSAVTYARRYGLGGLLALAVEDDDDANTATTPARTTPKVPSDVELAQFAENIDALSRAALAPAPPADGEIVVHFGKNKGTPVSQLRDAQVRWYAEEWQPNPNHPSGHASDADAALKGAAIAEHRRRKEHN